MTTPYWLQDAIFYQIFPDRFANGDSSNAPPNVQKWGAIPTNHGFQGGDLRGILRRFDYLLELGINALYFTPIFQSPSNHRYHTTDYFKIDEKLGDLADFHALLDMAHRNNVRVVIDGVFNHTGRGFFAFNDILENGEHSPYKDWYHIRSYPVDAYSPGEAHHYLAWWNIKGVPKLNTKNPAVRNYIFKVARYWIERGSDGWRLDVPNEIDDDEFWAEFRHVVKSANRDACLIGEIWDGNPRWVGPRHFDGLMHYPFRNALLDGLTGKLNAVEFASRLEGLLTLYPRENAYAMYLPLGSHDTERIMTLLNANLAKAKLAFLLQFAYPGAPAIYYGDEIGLEGGKDPDNRRAFPWNPADWKGDLHPWVQELIDARKARPSVRWGEYVHITADAAAGWCAFARTFGGEKTLIVANLTEKLVEASIPIAQFWADGRAVRSLLDSRPFVVQDGKITISLPAWGGMWIG
jgi:cyclomaltodextrinase / maltogenic alpha-amylase / neopullulanase